MKITRFPRFLSGIALGILLLLFCLVPSSDPERSSLASRRNHPSEYAAPHRLNNPAETPAALRDFGLWLQRWQEAAERDREVLKIEGLRLIQDRRRVMADLMVSNPRRAWENRLTQAEKSALPQDWQGLIEKKVNGVGDYFVAGVKPAPGFEDRLPSMVRWAEFDGETYHVATWGRGEDFLTKKRVPLNGIALPADAGTNPVENPVVRPGKILALSPDPGRELEPEEIAALVAENPPVCPTSGERVTAHDKPAAVEWAGNVKSFCGPAHLRQWSDAAFLDAGLTTPDPDLAVAASGGEGTATAHSGLPTAASAYTEGYKRFLFLRVRFSDSSGSTADTISESRATDLMAEMVAHHNAMSWGRMKIAPLGPSGSNFTTPLQLNQPASYYNDAGLSRLYPDARTAAQNAGYNLGDYQWFAVFTNGRPSAGYAGLAYVGGVGIHIANGYFGQSVLTHELGHNLGLPHAHRWDTGDNSIIGDGSNVEYGNDQDPIGSGGDSMHYTASHKDYLGWMPNGGPRIGTAGIYRIHYCDFPTAGVGLRSLRVGKDGGKDYWFDFRSNLGGTEYANGLIMHWTNTDGRQSYRLDALPRQGGITLPIGKMFSDNAAGVHVTPLRKTGTFPASMDVAVGFSSASNKSPTATLTAHQGPVTSATACTFSAAAVDADGDPLAYYWDFGDGTHSWDNSPVVTRTFAADGDYAVHCAVSDARGGTWRRTVVQQIGAPVANQWRVTGRVVDGDSKPMAGIRVAYDNDHYAWTDSDGTYWLCRVASGVRTISAMDVVENRTAFSRTFTSSLNVTGHLSGMDISVTEVAPKISTALVAKLSTWKFNDTGTALPAAWRSAAYDDAAWPQGPGMLGYGNGGEGTVVSYGGDPQNKRTTCYFRKKFTVAAPSVFKELRLQCKRDDAVMVYLNGTRIFSNNFASGIDENTITHATSAADSTEPDSYLAQNGLSNTLILAGENILAAEVHQVEPTSSDLAFDLELTGIQDAPSPGAQAAYVSSHRDGDIIPSGSTSVSLTAEARARTATVAKVEFFADNAKIGEDTTAPFGLDWSNPATGAHQLHVVATFSAGPPLTSGKVSVTVGPVPATLIAAGSTWSYRANSAAPPPNWTQVEYSDASWQSGPAQLGYGDGDEARTFTGAGVISQFRHTFSLQDPAALTNVLARLVRDDAAVVHVNGVLAYRSNFAADGTVLGAGDATIENAWHAQPLDAALFRPGKNTIAVEGHQTSAASSDCSFDFSLSAQSGAARPRGVYLAAPVSVLLPGPADLAAEALPGLNLSVARVEFFANGVKIGEDISYPFAFSWNPPASGSFSLTAVATDSANATFTGAAVNLTVLAEAQGTALVRFGDGWKYLDDGSDPGGNWMGRTSFDDSGWPQGLSRLGYGGDGEATTLFFSNAAAKPPTVYFRKKFNVATPSQFQNLRLRIIRDDGISVLLNRTELVRDNLPGGTLGFTTLASATATPEEEQSPVEFIVPATALAAGENQLAVEVHQAAADSSDFSFDFELTGMTSPAASPSVWLTSPSNGAVIEAGDGVRLDIGHATAIVPQKVEYFAGAAKIGERTAAPWSLTWPNPLKGSYPVTARIAHAGGAATTSAAAVTVVGSTVTQRLIWSGADWKFLDSGTAPAATWNSASFSDSSWRTGRSRLGFGGDGETTFVTPGKITYWFRKSFSVPAGLTVTAATLKVQRDDGIQLFLNGNRIWLNGLTDPVDSATLADSSISGSDEQIWHTVPLSPGLLTAGNHLFAAEIHQSSATSSDLAFDLTLDISWMLAGGVTNTAPAQAPQAVFSRAPQNAWHFSLIGAPGQIYRLESSTNLLQWIPESTTILTGPNLDTTLPQNGPSRFYRAKWLPNP